MGTKHKFVDTIEDGTTQGKRTSKRDHRLIDARQHGTVSEQTGFRAVVRKDGAGLETMSATGSHLADIDPPVDTEVKVCTNRKLRRSVCQAPGRRRRRSSRRDSMPRRRGQPVSISTFDSNSDTHPRPISSRSGGAFRRPLRAVPCRSRCARSAGSSMTRYAPLSLVIGRRVSVPGKQFGVERVLSAPRR